MFLLREICRPLQKFVYITLLKKNVIADANFRRALVLDFHGLRMVYPLVISLQRFNSTMLTVFVCQHAVESPLT